MIEIEGQQMVVFPVYWCGLCKSCTPHLVLHATASWMDRAIAQCQACSRTHWVELDEVIES